MDAEKSNLRAQNQCGFEKRSYLNFCRKRLGLSLFISVAASLFILYRVVVYCESISQMTLTEPEPGQQFVLGIALTPTYGTVAVRNRDGKLEIALKLPGDRTYINMMKRLSDPNSRHLSEPYGTIGDAIADWPRQTLRSVRKRIGLPASSDVGTLAQMVTDLKASLSERAYAVDKSGVILAFPAITSLYEEDSKDTIEYLGLPSLLGTRILFHEAYLLDSAYSGYGYGLCTDWQDPEKCRKEHDELLGRRTLVVDYTRGALSIDFMWMRSPSGSNVPPFGSVVDFDAGSDSKMQGNEGDHWRYILKRIQDLIASKVWATVDLVLMTGESAGDPDFQATVENAVSDYSPEIRTSTEPEFVAANGISELAYRAAVVQHQS